MWNLNKQRHDLFAYFRSKFCSIWIFFLCSSVTCSALTCCYIIIGLTETFGSSCARKSELCVLAGPPAQTISRLKFYVNVWMHLISVQLCSVAFISWHLSQLPTPLHPVLALVQLDVRACVTMRFYKQGRVFSPSVRYCSDFLRAP